MKKEYVYETRAQILAEVDVLVAGGGAAGVTAALAAARNGAKTMLVEKCGCIGGMLTAGNAGITMFTKFSGNPDEHAADLETLKHNPGELHIAGGITMEIAQRLLSEKIGIGNEASAGSYIFTSSEDFKHMLLQMMREAGVELRLHTLVTDVVREDELVHGIIIESKSGREMIPAKMFIDATGDGDVAARAGVPYTVGVTDKDYCAAQHPVGEMQVMGMMFKVGNVDLFKTFEWLEKHPEHFKKQPFARFTFAEARERFLKHEMATFEIIRDEIPERIQVNNLPIPGVVVLVAHYMRHDMDGCKAEDLTQAEIDMADILGTWMDGLHCIPGFEESYLLHAPEIGVRETRHIQGDYTLNLMDIYKQKNFDDCIGLGSHPIDAYPRPDWIDDPESSYPSRWYFQIPFRSLTASGVDNLLTAGRCISATHEAFGCIRPTVQCMITGEAAGTAAAMCASDNKSPRELDYKSLRVRLVDQGVKC